MWTIGAYNNYRTDINKEMQTDGNLTGERVQVNLWNDEIVLNIIGYFNGAKISYPSFLDKTQKACLTVAHAFNSEAEAGGTLWVQGQAGLEWQV